MMMMIQFQTAFLLQNKKQKPFCPFAPQKKKRSCFPRPGWKETYLCTCVVSMETAGPMSRDSMCDICGSLAEYISPMKHTTWIPCSLMRKNTPATCQKKTKSPQARYSLGCPRVKTTHQELAIKLHHHSNLPNLKSVWKLETLAWICPPTLPFVCLCASGLQFEWETSVVGH